MGRVAKPSKIDEGGLYEVIFQSYRPEPPSAAGSPAKCSFAIRRRPVAWSRRPG